MSTYSNAAKTSYFARLKKSLKKHWILYVFFSLPFAYIIIFSYIPMYGIVMAFQDFSVKAGYFGSPWVGFENFSRFFRSAMFSQLMYNTITISLYSMIAGYFTTIIFALMVNEVRYRRLKKTVQMISYLPYFISTVIIVSMLNQIFSLNGVINNFMQSLGFSPYSFFGNASTFRHMYVWSGIWSGVGYGSVIYIAAMAKVDTELYEAAVIDGANKLQKIWYIDIPTIMPTMTILLILNISGIMGVGFEKVYLMQNRINLGVSQVISTYVYQTGLISQQYSFSAAVGLFNTVINLFLLLFANMLARKFSETSLW